MIRPAAVVKRTPMLEAGLITRRIGGSNLTHALVNSRLAGSARNNATGAVETLQESIGAEERAGFGRAVPYRTVSRGLVDRIARAAWRASLVGGPMESSPRAISNRVKFGGALTMSHFSSTLSLVSRFVFAEQVVGRQNMECRRRCRIGPRTLAGVTKTRRPL